MILVASDKYKGTLGAREVCEVVAQVLGRERCMRCPMADGGEGTAAIMAEIYGMQRDPRGWFALPDKSLAAVDSSEHIGIDCVARAGKTVMTADSEPLGRILYQMQIEGYRKIMVGVGGTGTCDGGTGLLYYPLDPTRFVGLIDVQVPLLAPDGEPSALMFAPQKGATPTDIPILRVRLQKALELTDRRSIYDGAGGGLGFALASVLGAECISGAEAVLEAYHIDWQQIEMVITGEGCMDSQTEHGKVVHTVCAEARKRGIPVIIIAGQVAEGITAPAGARLISTTDYLPNLPLNRFSAVQRLRMAAASL